MDESAEIHQLLTKFYAYRKPEVSLRFHQSDTVPFLTQLKQVHYLPRSKEHIQDILGSLRHFVTF